MQEKRSPLQRNSFIKAKVFDTEKMGMTNYAFNTLLENTKLYEYKNCFYLDIYLFPFTQGRDLEKDPSIHHSFIETLKKISSCNVYLHSLDGINFIPLEKTNKNTTAHEFKIKEDEKNGYCKIITNQQKAVLTKREWLFSDSKWPTEQDILCTFTAVEKKQKEVFLLKCLSNQKKINLLTYAKKLMYLFKIKNSNDYIFVKTGKNQDDLYVEIGDLKNPTLINGPHKIERYHDGGTIYLYLAENEYGYTKIYDCPRPNAYFAWQDGKTSYLMQNNNKIWLEKKSLDEENCKTLGILLSEPANERITPLKNFPMCTFGRKFK